MSRYLWRFYWDCGRQGDVEGLFVATEEEINNIIGEEVNFGEILGKHSEVYGTIEEKEEITKLDLDSETVEKVSKILGDTWSGYNPLKYVNYSCEKCDCSYHAGEWDFEKNMCVYCATPQDDED
jgi:hypothetical protein